MLVDPESRDVATPAPRWAAARAAAPSTPAAPCLVARELVGERGGITLWGPLNLVIRAGEAWRITGGNGQGKTTLLRTLAGLREPAAGRVERACAVALVGHQDALDEALDVPTQWHLAARLAGLPTLQDAQQAALLDALALPADRPARQLSAGQRRKAALALPTLQPGRLWLLDEPFDALDHRTLDWLSRCCRDHLAQGGALVYVSHQEPPPSFPSARKLALDAPAPALPAAWPQALPTFEPISPAVPALAALAARELRLAVARPGELAWHAAFFVAVLALFPLALEPDPPRLRAMAPAVVWTAALLALLLAAARAFQDERRQGWLDQWLLAAQATGVPLAWHALLRIGLQWALVALPLVAAATLGGLAFGLAPAALAVQALALALGSFTVTAWALLAAALATGLRAASMLVLLIVLPLAAPVVIFGAAAVRAADQGLPATAPLALLAALGALAAIAGPWLLAAALRSAVEQS